MEPEALRGRDPRKDKDLDYTRQRRSAAEYPHAARRQLPRKKAHAQRAFRRGAAQALRSARGRMHDEQVQRAAIDLDRVSRRTVVTWTSPTLGEHVQQALDKRVQRVGWNFFKHPYDSDRHRRPFARFLAALTAGRQGRSWEVARRFGRILDAPKRADPSPLRVWPPSLSQNHQWLSAFFADEPEWEQKLRRWIAEVRPPGHELGGEPHDPG